MKRKAYCCDASRHMYEDYYSRQVDGEISVFAGSRHQRGHGIGSVLGGLFRRFVIPLFTTHGRTLALDALRTGMNVAEDVLGGGRGLMESVKKRVPEGIKRTAQNLISQSGSGNRRRRIVDNNNNSKKKKTKTTKKKKCNRYSNDAHINDIFA